MIIEIEAAIQKENLCRTYIFSKVKKKEICDELLALYNKGQIDAVFDVLCEIAKGDKIDYQELLEEFLKYDMNEDDIRTLVEYSLLVPVDELGYQYFVYRENSIPRDISRYSFSVPKIIKTYFSANIWH